MSDSSPHTGPLEMSLEGLDVRLEHLEGGYSVCFESHTADADLAPLFQGLPDNRCQIPRWGYVVEGMITFRQEGGEATYVAGDAYYVPPGHTPIHYEGARVVEFSPSDGLQETMATVFENVAAMEPGQ